MKKILLALVAVGILSLAASAEASAGVKVEANCGAGAAEKRPSEMHFICADNGVYATSLSWRSWGGSRSKAFGRVWWNSCDPICGAFNFRHGKGKVTLSGKVHCGGHLFKYSTLRVKAFDGPTLRVPLTTC